MARARVDQQIALINNATFKKKIELEAKLPGLQIKLKKAMMAHEQVKDRITNFLRREEETTLRKMEGPEQDRIYNAVVNTFGADVVAEIERKYGPPFQYNAKGIATMSQLFWAMALLLVRRYYTLHPIRISTNTTRRTDCITPALNTTFVTRLQSS
jgi:hypothetical protein